MEPRESELQRLAEGFRAELLRLAENYREQARILGELVELKKADLNYIQEQIVRLEAQIRDSSPSVRD